MTAEVFSSPTRIFPLRPLAIEIAPLTTQEFRLFQRFIYEHAGIHLADAKRALLVGRLSKRLRELKLQSFTAYYEAVQASASERVLMFDAICTNETYFFREPKQFEFIGREVVPRWKSEAAAAKRGRHVRVWSAACSSGEEPYSIAMLLRYALPAAEGWTIEIVATDLSTKVLRKAATALYPLTRAEHIPKHLLKAYMLKGTRSHEGTMMVGPEIRQLVSFQQMNLNDHDYPVDGSFDLIFCRNVLIYFDAVSKARVISKLLHRLTPEGIFLLGSAESLNRASEQVRSVGPIAYTRL